MKFYTMTLKNENGEDEEIKMRLTSLDCIEIEKKYNTRLIDMVQDYSITNVVAILKYMRKDVVGQYTDRMAYDFYDRLVDNGYTLVSILQDIIYEVLAISGILSQEDLENLKNHKEETPERKN